MADLGRAVYILTADATRFQRGLTAAEMASNTMVARIGRGFSRLGMRMQSFGRDMSLYVTGPILYAAKHSLDALSSFEDEIRKSIGLAEVGKKQYGTVTREILSMSRELGKGPQELAEGLYFISSAGFKANASMKILRQSAMGAAAGLGEVNEVGDAVTSVLNAYGRENIKAKQAVDVLTTSVRYGKGEADAMAKTIGVVIAVAQQAGVEFNEVGAAAAAMTRLGIPAARAMTSLRSIMGRFADPTDEVKEGLKKIGLTAKEVRVMMEEETTKFSKISASADIAAGMKDKEGNPLFNPKLIAELREGHGGLFNTLMMMQIKLQDAGVQTAEIFDSIRAQPGFEAITGASANLNLGIFDSTIGALSGTGKEADSTRKAFEQMEKSVGMDMRKMHAAIEVAEILFGKTIAPMARRAAENLGDLAESFSKLSKPMRENIAKWVGIAAAAGPVSFIVGSLLRQVRFLLTPMGLLTALFVAAAIALGKIHVKGSDTITMLDKLLAVGKKVVTEVFDAAREVWNEYKGDLAAFARDVFPKVVEFFKSVGDFVEAAMPTIGVFVDTLVDLGRSVLPPLLDLFGGLLSILQGLFSLLGGGGGIGRIIAYGVAWAGVLKVIKLLNVGMRQVPGQIASVRGSLSLANALGAPGPDGSMLRRTPLGVMGTSPGTLTQSIRNPGILPMGPNAGQLSQWVPTAPGIVGATSTISGNYLNLANYRNQMRSALQTSPGMYTTSSGAIFTETQRAASIASLEQQMAGLRDATSRASASWAGITTSLRNFGAGMRNFFSQIFGVQTILMVGVMHVMAEWQRWGDAQRRLDEIKKITPEAFQTGEISFKDINEQIAEQHDIAGSGVQGHGKWSMAGLWESIMHTPSAIRETLTGTASLPSSVGVETENALLAQRREAMKEISSNWFDLAGMGGDRAPRGEQEAGAWNAMNNILMRLQERTFGGSIELEDADAVAKLTANYRGLGGTFEDVSGMAINMYLANGKVTEAQELLEKATRPVLKAFREQTKELLESESTYKRWGSIVESAIGFSARQRRSFLLLADAIETSGTKLSDKEKQLIRASVETGNYGKAMATLAETLGMTFGEAGTKVDDLKKLLDEIPKQYRRQVIVDVKLARKGKLGQEDSFQATIDELMFGMDASKFDPSKAASIRVLTKIMKDTGVELGEKSRKALRNALKGGSLDEALDILGGKVEKVPEALKELNKWRTEHHDDPFLIEFETNIDDVVHEVELGFQDIWNLAPPKFDVDNQPAKDSISDIIAFATGGPIKVGLEVTDKKGGGGGASGGWNNVPWGSYHTGGRVGGRGDIPAVLEGGEFVVNKSAAARFGSTLEQINKYHSGGWVNPGAETKDAMRRTVDTVIGEAARYAGEYVRANRGRSGGGGGRLSGGILQIARAIDSMGFDVGEGPGKFGPVNPVHTANSWHYKGLAIDVNWPGANEPQKLRGLYNQLKGVQGLEELFFDGLGIPHAIGGHDDHLHFAMNGESKSIHTGRGFGNAGRFGFSRPGQMTFQASVRGLQKLLKAGGGQHGMDLPKGTPESVAEAVSWGKKLAASRYGWTGNEWNSLYHLWSNESGWQPGRLNPSSFAAGIPQALPGSKIYGAAFNSMPRVTRDGKLFLKNPDAKREISWGLDYIKQRADYGKPSLAWQLWNERSPHWYGDGAVFKKPRVVGVGDGRYDEAVVPLTSQVGQRALERMGGARDSGAGDEIEHLVDVLERFANREGDIVLKLDEDELARIRRKKERLRSVD